MRVVKKRASQGLALSGTIWATVPAADLASPNYWEEGALVCRFLFQSVSDEYGC